MIDGPGKLYSVIELQKFLYSKGYSIPLDDLYEAMKETGWIKLFLIRERLLDLKKKIPKGEPFDSLRHIVKWPLLVDRFDDGSRRGHPKRKLNG
jgi:hypothetical protein